jgi:pimeloyl-ACP methyl ester carboxylesterase
VLGFGLLGTLLAASKGAAHQGGYDHLTLRPREIARAARTARAGLLTFPDISGRIYVPTRCVGTRPCPLLLTQHPDMAELFWLGDKYGFVISEITNDSPDRQKNTAAFEALFTRIFQLAVIDLDKIALLGHCAGGVHVMDLAAKNLDVFSRMIVISSATPPSIDDMDPPNGKAQFLIGSGALEASAILEQAGALQRQGHTVKMFPGFREHTQTWETFEFAARWLVESWAIPDTAARPLPDSVPDVRLTTEALTQLTAFWTRFMQEPDSIRTAARRAHLREIRIPVALQRMATLMTDIAGLAAQYPSVAAALRDAGLTAQQHEAYRVALLSVLATQSNLNIGDVDPWTPLRVATSAQQENFKFLETHQDELNALLEAGTLTNP